MYIFPEFDDFLIVEDFWYSNDSGLAFSSSRVDFVDMDEVMGSELDKLIVHYDFNKL